MIFVDRKRVALPPQADKLAKLAEEMASKFFERRDVARRQSRFEFRDAWKLARFLRPVLMELFHHKCAYCESELSVTDPGAVDHFRPAAMAADLKGDVSPDHYWWLASEWDNLYMICQQCNGFKRNLFPMRGKRAALMSRGEALDQEEPLLLDPCKIQPSKSLLFQANGVVRGLDERGQVTLKVLNLNREGLVRKRRELATTIQRELELFRKVADVNLYATLLSRMNASAPYAALARALLREKLPQAGGVGEAVPPREAHVSRKLRSMAERVRIAWPERIELANFRGIEELDLRFPSPGEPAGDSRLKLVRSPTETESGERREPWLMLVGPNGVGKSSVLKAIALALVDERQRRRLAPRPSELFNRRTRLQTGLVRVHFTDGQMVQLEFGKRSRTFTVRGHALKQPLLAYGATRLLSRVPERPRRVRVDNLFDPGSPLGDAEGFLSDRTRLSTRNFNVLASSLRQLLDLEEGDHLVRGRGAVTARLSNTSVPLRDLSDGYQSLLAMATHIMVNLSPRSAALDYVAGTVLLDEVEVHLHPTWKIRVVRNLREMFPRVRFVATTHDPLCLRGLEPGEIKQLRRDESGSIMARDVDVPPGLHADQILTGQWFGLNTTLDADTLALMSLHSRLLAKTQDAGSAEKKALLEAELSRRQGAYLDTAADRIASSAVGDFIRERGTDLDRLTPEQRAELRAKVDEVLRREEWLT